MVKTINLLGAIVFTIILSTTTAFAGHGETFPSETFPDYIKDANVTLQTVCDNGATQYTKYKGSSYSLLQHWRDYEIWVITTESGNTFFELFSSDLGSHFFQQEKDSLILIEKSHEQWTEALYLAAREYLFYRYSRQNDCVEL